MTFHTQIFVPTLAVGVPFVCGAWFLTRQRAHDSRLWRFCLSFLTAAVVTPTVCSISGEPGIYPAVLHRVLRTAGKRRGTGAWFASWRSAVGLRHRADLRASHREPEILEAVT